MLNTRVENLNHESRAKEHWYNQAGSAKAPPGKNGCNVGTDVSYSPGTPSLPDHFCCPIIPCFDITTRSLTGISRLTGPEISVQVGRPMATDLAIARSAANIARLHLSAVFCLVGSTVDWVDRYQLWQLPTTTSPDSTSFSICTFLARRNKDGKDGN